MKRPFHGLLAPLLLTLAACAPATRVVLLPQEGVPTADEVDEPKNRRAEVVVR